ncbi:MAG: CRTAC1 family protein [Verrucomicrobiales bacterium]|nr:CRTAC1 family protein [Verrucomicrobiales bacterium]
MQPAPPSPPSPQPEHDPEDLVHYDDAVIGRATRLSLIAVIALVLLGGGAFWWFNRPRPAAAPHVTALTAPVAATAAAQPPPKATFTDITASAGLRFHRYNGAEGEKLLPETMGGGAAFFDADHDGDQDLVLVNGAPWPWAKSPPTPPPTSALYLNDGQGRFTDATAGSGLDRPLQGMGVACGDFDNDGLVDLYLTGVGPNRLLRNLGGARFEDVTPTAKVAGASEAWSTAATFLDYDRDGDLDLFVANYVQWSREIDFKVGFSLDGQHRAYGPPMSFQGAFPVLYRNDGQGRFTDVSEAAGVQVRNASTAVPAAKSLGVTAADLNQDGWIDLVVANDTVQNHAFTNRHDGTFAEAGFLLGMAFDSNGNARGAMGIDIARHRNNDSLAIAIGNFANEMTSLYVRGAHQAVFTDEAIAESIGPASRLLLKFGLLFLDYDLDGWLDVLTANGHLEEDISKIQKSQSYRQPAQLFWNSGGAEGGFVEVSRDLAGPDLFQPIVGRGSACADIDGDGDLDVLLMQASGPPLLLRNDQTLGHHWLRVRLTGTQSNRDAIGSWITLKAGGVTQSRQVMPSRSYLSQSELTVTFGLGNATTIESLEVTWPSGTTQRIPAPKIDSLVTLVEP